MTKGIQSDIRELLALRYYSGSIQFFNNQKVDLLQAGNRLSLARGRGMDFEEVRSYNPGDDIRLIHWPLTARLGKPYTKIYREERERAVYLLIDQSSSMQFGTKVCFKSVLASKLAALLGWAALNNHEQIGGIVFNNNASEYVKPKRSRKSLLDIFNLVSNSNKLHHNKGGLNNVLQFVLNNLQTGSIVIVISDFFEANEETLKYLNKISQKCEIINLFIYDILETKLPDFGQYNFTDDGKLQLQISADKKNQKLYSAPFLQRLEQIELFSRKNRMQFVKLKTNDDIVKCINHGITKYGY